MKCGVLTFIDTINYGAELQAYALVRAIGKLGAECELINYCCPAIAAFETPRLPTISDLRRPRHFLGKALKYPERKKRAAGFREFSRRHVPKGVPVNGAEDMLGIYDRIVVGSDQVWRFGLTGADRTFLVPGTRRANQRVISYAASFGDQSVPQSEWDVYRMLLSSFDGLGVRERRGVEILSEMGVRGATVNVDPTLLLDSAEWGDLASEPRVSGRYVFAYLAAAGDMVVKTALEAARVLDAELLYIDPYRGRPISGARNVGRCSPDEFLGLVKGAEFVVTSSFHGLCFSILFNKQFRYVLAARRRGSRLYNLVSELGLESYDASNGNLEDAIDYSQPNERLAHLRAESEGYLAGHIF